jgi:manganese/zinc/iron transport system permease protein
VAVTTVAAFEVVGSILVVAMLIVPGATAHLLTNRLAPMLIVSVIVGAVGASLGALLTTPGWIGYVDTNTAGMMAVSLGAVFTVVMLLAPEHGVLSRLARRAALGRRIVREDLLGLLYRMEEHRIGEAKAAFAQRVQAAMGLPRWRVRLALASLRRQRLIDADGAQLVLTESGRAQARDLVRSHRLWEAYLVKHFALPADHVHGTAARLEHVTGALLQERLADVVDHPSLDPHGRTIPPPGHTTRPDPEAPSPSSAPPPSDAGSRR